MYHKYCNWIHSKPLAHLIELEALTNFFWVCLPACQSQSLNYWICLYWNGTLMTQFDCRRVWFIIRTGPCKLFSPYNYLNYFCYKCMRTNVVLVLKNERPTWCHLLFYFTSYVFNMFWTLIYPSSGACDCVVELPHRSSCVKTDDLALV